jgi:DNA-3-methyladenine glycosylase II
MFTETGTLTPNPPFDFNQSLNFLGVFMPTKQEQTIASHTLAKAISIDGQIIVFQLISIGTTENPQLEYTLFSAEPITEEKQNAVVERMTFFLSLNDDLLPFYRIGHEDADFDPIIEIL